MLVPSKRGRCYIKYRKQHMQHHWRCHFRSDNPVEQLFRSHPTSFVNSEKAPLTSTIWAEDGVPSPSTTDVYHDALERWVFEERKKSGPFGWDKLLPNRKISTASTRGTIFNDPPT